MDDLRIGFSSLCLVLVFVGAFARSAEIEYISPQRRLELETSFAEAKGDPSGLSEAPWVCDMYGVKSSLQVQRGLLLYRWDHQWLNKGAQLVNQYRIENGSLIGSKGRFEDEVRLAANGQLISRLRLSTTPASVVAYSVCKKSL